MSLCFLSLETSKVFNKSILKNLEENRFYGLSEALIVLFPYISESKKITSSQLSKKVGYSRQAIHKNIKKLIEYEYITLNLENEKEKNIQLTPKGNSLVKCANEYIETVEKEIASLIGNKELDIYKKTQNQIYEHLQSK